MNGMAVVGYGVVGKATAKVFGIDKYFDLQGSNCSLKDIAECQMVFVCIPTPTVNGECDTTAIRDLILQVKEIGGSPLFVIRSTVIPGTCRRLQELTGNVNIISNPEFLSEDTAEDDSRHPKMVVIGSELDKYAEFLKARYDAVQKGLHFIITDTVTAETIKYAMNTFFTVKNKWANSMYNVCEKNGANYETIKNVMEYHPWGSKNHFDIWHKGGRGAGGKCLGKDTQAFATYSDDPFFKIVDIENRNLLSRYPKKS